MARILAIDYGGKRVGVAVSDPMRMIANRLDTVPSSRIIEFLEEYLETEQVDCIVVGEPKQMNNEPSQSHEMIENFVKHLHKKFPNIKIERGDERFTSKIAFQTMVEGGLKKNKRNDKELIDGISAAIILQSYLDKLANS